jgi:hypothetical protein
LGESSERWRKANAYRYAIEVPARKQEGVGEAEPLVLLISVTDSA